MGYFEYLCWSADSFVSSGNLYSRKEVVAICRALEGNTTVRSLDLSCEFFCSAACDISQFRADVLYCDERGLLFQFSLFGSGCRLCFSFEGGALAVLIVCVCNDPPVSSDNGIGDEGAAAIAKALEKNTTLQRIELWSEFFCSAACGVSQFCADVLYCDE